MLFHRGDFVSVLIGLVLTVALLIAAVLNDIYLGYPLLFGYLYFAVLCLKKNRSLASLITMSWSGAKVALIIIPVLLLLGCLTAMWMASGTVASFVYYGLSFIRPQLFIIITFLVTAAVSLLLGSTFGTVGTIGVIFMAMAKGGNVDPFITAGTIIAAAFVGDRCSPMAAVLHLISTLTETEVYRNLKMVLKTALGPFLLAALLYLLLSLLNPLAVEETTLRQDIAQYFVIGLIPLVPALIIITLCCFKINIKLSILISAVCAAFIARFLQDVSWDALFFALLWGFEPGPHSSLAGIIQGGGFIGMLRTSFILLVSCTLSGVLLGIEAMRGLDKLLAKPCSRFMRYLKTAAVGFLGICCGCSQTISIVICGQALIKPYELNGLSRYDLARDISLTIVPFAAFVPWCLVSMVSTTTLGVPPAGHLPYLFYPLLLPLWHGVSFWLEEVRRKKLTDAGG